MKLECQTFKLYEGSFSRNFPQKGINLKIAAGRYLIFRNKQNTGFRHFSCWLGIRGNGYDRYWNWVRHERHIDHLYFIIIVTFGLTNTFAGVNFHLTDFSSPTFTLSCFHSSLFFSGQSFGVVLSVDKKEKKKKVTREKNKKEKVRKWKGRIFWRCCKKLMKSRFVRTESIPLR